MTSGAVYDYILVGGGLQNSLIALGLLRRRPSVRLAIVEREARLGGNHTWCFHESDVPAELGYLVDPLIVHRWPGYEVRFPSRSRTLAAPYAAITSVRLSHVVEDAVAAADGATLATGVAATAVEGRRVALADGRTLTGPVVIDARGPTTTEVKHAGYQKFVGHEVVLGRPHHLQRPIIMDATVAQRDGYRFVYTLPLAEDRLLIEDTYFSDTPELRLPALRERIAAYAKRLGLHIREVVREETGILPMPWASAAPAPSESPLVAGYRGGWFHPGTGYSLPVAIRLADLVAKTPRDALFGAKLRALRRQTSRQARYCHWLNRMLFNWFAPRERWRIFDRFYRLPGETIRRFYALRMTRADQLRILVGRPSRGLSLNTRLQKRRVA